MVSIQSKICFQQRVRDNKDLGFIKKSGKMNSTSQLKNGIEFDIQPVPYHAQFLFFVGNAKKRLAYIPESHQNDVYCFHIAIILLYSKGTLKCFLSLLLGGKNSVGLGNLGFCNFPCLIYYKFYAIAS
jgi:hypothetical protein